VTAWESTPTFPREGDFAQRKDGNSNIHIVYQASYDTYGRRVVMYCGKAWYSAVLAHVDTDGGGRRDCRRCWAGITGNPL
jgi:hypothetical protein